MRHIIALLFIAIALSGLAQEPDCYSCPNKFGGAVTVSPNITGAVGAVTYSWICDNGQNSSNEIFSVQPNVDDYSDITCYLTAIDSLGCQFTDSLVIGVYEDPVITLAINANCEIYIGSYDIKDFDDCDQIVLTREVSEDTWQTVDNDFQVGEFISIDDDARYRLEAFCGGCILGTGYFPDTIQANCGIICETFDVDCSFMGDTLKLINEPISGYTVNSDTLQWRKVDPADSSAIAGENWQIYSGPLTGCDIKETIEVDWYYMVECDPFPTINGYKDLGFYDATLCDNANFDYTYVNVTNGNIITNTDRNTGPNLAASEQGMIDNGPLAFTVYRQTPIGLILAAGQYNYIGDFNTASQDCNELEFVVTDEGNELYYTIEWRRIVNTVECGIDTTSNFCVLSDCGPKSVSATCNSTEIAATPIGCTGTPTYKFFKGGQLLQSGTSNTFVNPTDGLYIVQMECDGCTVQSTVDCDVACTANATITNNGNCGLILSNLTGCTSGGLTYQWYKDFSAIAGATGTSISINENGNYWIRVTGCNSCNDITSNTVNINACTTPCNTNASISNNNCTLTANVTGCEGSPTYSWSTGASTQSISVAADQVYSVTITGCCQTVVRSINVVGCAVNPCQNYSITVNPINNQTVCDNAPQIISFSTTKSNGTSPYTYQWKRNGVTVGTSSTYNFNTSGFNVGTYQIEGRVTDANNCFDNDFTSVIIQDCNDPCVMTTNISPDNQTICEGESITYTRTISNGTAPYSTLWYVDGVFKSGGTSYTYIPSSGSDVVRVDVTDDEGCFDSDQTNLTITDQCNCGANNCTLTLALNGCDLTWGTCPNYSSTLEYNTGSGWFPVAGNPQGSYTSTITASYRLKWSRSGCSNIIANTVNTSCTPNCNITATITPNYADVCEGESTLFAVNITNGSGNYNYEWRVDDVFKSSASTYNTTLPVGSNSVKITVTDINTGCVAIDTDIIVVEDFCTCGDDACNIVLQKSGCVLTWNNCAGFNVFLNYKPSGGSYQPVSGATSPYTAELDGDYNLSITRAGCINQVSNAVIVAGCAPTCNFTIGTLTSTPSCYPVNTIFNAGTGSGGTAPYIYEWYRDGNIVGNNQTYNTGTLAAGTYAIYVKVTDANGCEATSNTINKVIHPAVNLAASLQFVPDVFTPCRNVLFDANNGTPPYNINYLGTNYSDPHLVSTANQAASTTNNYAATVTDANGCTASANIDYSQRGNVYTWDLGVLQQGDFNFLTGVIVNFCDDLEDGSFLRGIFSTSDVVTGNYLDEYVIGNTTGCTDNELILSYNPNATLPSAATITSNMQANLNLITNNATATLSGNTLTINDPDFEIYRVEVVIVSYYNNNISMCEFINNSNKGTQFLQSIKCCYIR